MKKYLQLHMDDPRIISIAEKYAIRRISIFGSAIRDDFGPKSDVDLLIELSHERKYSYFDILEIQEQFEKIFLRKVDIVEKNSLRNPFRKESILNSAKEIYAIQQ